MNIHSQRILATNGLKSISKKNELGIKGKVAGT